MEARESAERRPYTMGGAALGRDDRKMLSGFHQRLRAEPHIRVDFRNEDVLAQRLSRLEERSASIDNSRRAERDSVRRAAGNIGSNDTHFVVPGPRDIDGPA